MAKTWPTMVRDRTAPRRDVSRCRDPAARIGSPYPCAGGRRGARRSAAHRIADAERTELDRDIGPLRG